MTEQKQKLWNYFILSARWLIAWTFLSYGWAKLSDGQFGISPAELETPVKDLGLFRLAWYLFDHEPFKSFIGISQIISGLLLIYNRTVILGALLSVPILLNILIIDITYLKMQVFYWRLSYYLLLVFVILWHYRQNMVNAFKAIYNNATTKFKYSFWAYLILPIMMIVLEVLGVLPRLLMDLITNPSDTLNGLREMFKLIPKVFES